MTTRTQKVKLIICCDGTACSEYIQNPNSSLTNVSRFARAVRQSDENGVRQIVLYLPGIGTDEGNRFNRWNHATGTGKAVHLLCCLTDFVEGLNNLILESYTFLSHNWAVGDDIILLGFSRGAFAMRCLADFIMKNGILPKEGLDDLHARFAEWKTGALRNIHAGNIVPIKVCALWDTVSTMGLSDPLSRGPHWFVDSRLQPNVENAFQALSLHEHRYQFPPLVWERGGATNNLEQCWFAGFHADIGGGDRDGALAQFALVWFFAKLRNFLSLEDAVLDRDPAIEAWRTTAGRECIFHFQSLPNLRGFIVSILMINLLENLGVKDPSKWYYHVLARCYQVGGNLRLFHPFGSSLFRRPRFQFRTPNGFVDGPIPRNGLMEEKMHSTLHFLDTNQAIPRSALCDGIVILGGGNVTWIFSGTKGRHPRLSRPPPAINQYPVHQEPLSPYERALLSRWAIHQQNQLFMPGNNATQLGAPPANTIVAALRAWL